MNIKEAKELLGKYKKITLDQLTLIYKATPYAKGKQILYSKTGFGSTNCILCQSAKNNCNNCIYFFRRKEYYDTPCIDIIYNEMEKATSAEELYNAIQKRISYLTHIIEWYETRR